MTDIGKRIATTQANREPFFMGGIRNVGQGLSLGTSDEIEAAIRANIEGRPYEEVLAEIRQSTSKYAEENPKTAMALQFAGGLPLAAVPFAGAARGLMGMAKAGAIEGGLTGIFSGEGGPVQRLASGAGGAVAGGLLAPVAGKLAEGIGSIASNAIDWTRRNFGGGASRAFQSEIDRLVASSGMTPDEIVQAVADGKLVSENQTLNAFARAYYADAAGGEAQAIIKQGLAGRPSETRNIAEEQMLGGLTGQTDQSARMLQDQAEQAATEYGNRAYAPFKSPDATVGPDVEAQLLAELRGTPSAGAELASAERTATQGGDIFARDKNGNITGFSRPLTIADAENIRRSLSNAASREFTAGAGLAGSAVQGAERNVRGTLDALYPELADVRANMAGFKAAGDAFTSGQRAATGGAQQAEIDLLQIASDPQQLDAYRRGFMDTIQKQLGTQGAASSVRNLLSEEASAGRIMRMIYPSDKVDDAIAALQRAVDAQTASNKILGGSQSMETASQMNASRGISLTDVIDAATGFSPTATLRAGAAMIDSMAPQLTVAEREAIARLLVERNPEVVRRALIDDGGWRRMQDIIKQTADIISRGAQAGAGSAGGQYGGDVTEVMVPREPLRLTISGTGQ